MMLIIPKKSSWDFDEMVKKMADQAVMLKMLMYEVNTVYVGRIKRSGGKSNINYSRSEFAAQQNI